jgi:hypothetical protein
MANRLGTANHAVAAGPDGYRLPAGTYPKLLREQCELRAQIEYVHNNPRCSALLDDWRAVAIECAQAEKLAALEAAETFAELLAAGGPIEVYAWQVRGRAMPGMPGRLISSGRVCVYPDDVSRSRRGITVEPKRRNHAAAEDGPAPGLSQP